MKIISASVILLEKFSITQTLKFQKYMDPEIKRYIFRVPSLPLKLIKIGTSEMVQVLSEKSDDLSSISYILMVEVENQSWQVLLGPPQAYGEKGVYAHSCTHTHTEKFILKLRKGTNLE